MRHRAKEGAAVTSNDGRSDIPDDHDHDTIRGGRRPKISALTALLMLVGLSGLAIAQPVFDLLEKNAAELNPSAPSRMDILVFAVIVVVLPPLAAWLAYMVVRLLSARLGHAVLFAVVAGLGAVFGFEIVKQATSFGPKLVVVGGVLIAGGIAFGAYRFAPVRTWLACLAVAPVVFAVLFTVSKPMESLTATPRTVFTHVRIGAAHRLVMVVFDEFPARSILDGSGNIDAEIAPNLSALAGDGTWYRNTSTAAAWTQRAVPAILTGRAPLGQDAIPNAYDYPGSVFSLLESRYRVNASEGIEAICPRSACDAGSRRSLNLGTGLRGVASVARLLYRDFANPLSTFEPDLFHPIKQQALARTIAFAGSLTPRSTPTFDYLHSLLPHQPWRYYGAARSVGSGPRTVYERWPGGAAAATAEQRHILQVQTTDGLLGRVVDRLKRIGAYKDSVIVVTADHGVSFDPAFPSRRIVKGNAPSIGFVPLIIKSAGNAGGRVVDDPTSTVDILHLVAGELAITADGLPRTPPPAERDGKTTIVNGLIARAVGPGAPSATFDRSQAYRELVSARGWPIPAGSPGRFYRAGPYESHFGQQVRVTPLTNSQRSVLVSDPQAQLTPWSFLSLASARAPTSNRWLAVTVNGRIAGFARQDASVDPRFSVSLDPDSFESGTNRVAVYEASGNPLQPLYTPVALATGPVSRTAVSR